MPHEISRNVDPNQDPEEMRFLLERSLAAMGEVVVVDQNCCMVFISDGYAETMDISIQDSLGKPITEVLGSNTAIPNVLKTGRPTKNTFYQRNGRNFWINRFPIRDGDKIIGVVSECMLTSSLESDEIKKTLERLTRELNFYKEKYRQVSTPRFTADNIVTTSRTVMELKDTIVQISATRSTVLLTGESGTGKEVFANAIHSLSPRRDKPFIRLNCAAIPDNLLEAELFGYEEGAFTGAIKGGKIGDFEAANGGTLLLDEVDALTPNLQAKLLRVIQEKEVRKVGSSKTFPIDVRFIFATNKDLLKLVEKKTFREDFYYRINVINLNLPPLRERLEDIPLLVEFFIKKFNKELEMNISGISPVALAMLQERQWPGNIRELENCLERAFNYSNGGGVLQLQQFRVQLDDDKMTPLTLKRARERAESLAIMRALDVTQGNKKSAAELLQIDRSLLYDKLKQYHIEF